MLRQRITAALLVFTLILASCSSPNEPRQTDWCYLYNFIASHYDANVLNGEYVLGSGFTQNASGFLTFNFSTPYVVQAAQVIVTVFRPENEDIDISANADVFGVDVVIGEGQPVNGWFPAAAPDRLVLPFNQDDSTAIGGAVNVSMSTSQPLFVESVEVRGYGVNPFPSNTCEQAPTGTASPTLLPDTPLPSETPLPATYTPSFTPSWSPTPSNTPTPTNTPPPTWCTLFDFTIGNGSFGSGVPAGWSGTGANYSAGVGWIAGNGTRGTGESIKTLSINRLMPAMANVTQVDLVITATFGTSVPSGASGSVGITYVSTPLVSSTSDYSGTMTWTGSSSYASNNWQIGGLMTYRNDFVAATGSGTILSVRFKGNGSNPFAALLDTATGLSNGLIDCNLIPTPTPTATASPTPSPTFTASPSRTLIPRTPTIGPSSTRTPISFASPTPFPTLGTIPASVTPLPTGTPVPSSTYLPVPTSMPTPEPGEGEGDGSIPFLGGILDGINGFFTWVVNSANNFGNWLGSALAWIQGTVANFGTLLGNLFSGILDLLRLALAFILDVFRIIGLIIAIVLHLFVIVGIFIGQLLARGQELYYAWFFTPPTPIPFLPQCVSNPIASDICAVWYILEFTLFGGPVGQLLVPTLTIVMGIGIILLFISIMARILDRSSEVTE